MAPPYRKKIYWVCIYTGELCDSRPMGEEELPPCSMKGFDCASRNEWKAKHGNKSPVGEIF